MKKYLVKSTSVIFIILTIIISAISFASAATLLDETKKVSVTMNCSKPGYTFELFRVADLTTTSGTTNETAYTPLFDSIASEVKAGNSKNLLAKLDTLSPINTAMPTGAVSCGTFQTTSSSTTKTFSSLNQGIYYVKCTKYPAGVKSVTNSVFALPYYQNNSWVYTLSAINLANKVVDGTPQTDKEITNSTKNNKNFTDVSVGDTVEFALNNTVTGSATNKLTQYTVKDKMSKGLTFNKDSVKVYLADSSKTKIADLTKDTDDRSMEQMMKGIPNFYLRGSVIVVTGNFRYTAEMCDCEYCGYYGGKKKGCLVPKCVCLEERISVGIAY